jgi:phosphoribosylaminoimidazole-succinocarboxamide synthase
MQYDSNGALLQTDLTGYTPQRGKVRDVYDLGDTLLFVATDRISAFDCVMPNGIPDKGKVLTQLSLFWFEYFSDISNHLITAEVSEYPETIQACNVNDDLAGRSMLVKKTNVIPVECVARGYLVGSGWKEYQASRSVCSIPLREGYEQADKLDHPLFTPAFKAEHGEHDENISFERMCELTDRTTAETLRDLTLAIYQRAADFAQTKGIIIADTKFEFGRNQDGELILIDEVLTPDSSRFWPASEYCTGNNPPSLDKQFVRDYLESINFDKEPPAPELPAEVVRQTRKKYLEALIELTGSALK